MAKAATEAKKKKAAEALDKDNADTTQLAASGNGQSSVYVFANLQSGQSFTLPPSPEHPDGHTVTVNGMPVSSLKGLDGQRFPGGKYGVTQVPAEQWAQVLKIYGKMKIFQNGLVFDAPTLEHGKAMARERGGLRHGYEQVDPLSERAKTMPHKED